MPNDQYTLAKHGPEYVGAGRGVNFGPQVERIIDDAIAKEYAAREQREQEQPTPGQMAFSFND